ncbi:hypothetical protein H0H87_008890 [Tephrocybe sp. NHM501043]|nr:hypothetical protein H0H87_008890 [Tephrocybe sp. NHM501043]
MAYPTSPLAQGFDVLDLDGLARTTIKTFERLAPYTLLQNPSSLEARPAVIKITNKIKSYIEAIDTTIQVVHIAYKMSKLAAVLWNTPTPSSEKYALKDRMEWQKHLEDIVVLADEAYQQAQKSNSVFRQVEQDFYRIAASTKNIESTVQIPVDPALRECTPLPFNAQIIDQELILIAKMLKKPLKDIGPDLVSNLNLLADFTRHSTDLTTWCGWVRSGIIAINGSVVPPRGGAAGEDDAVRLRWDRIRAD